MDDPDQAKAYADSDFTEPHNAFIAYFRERFPDFSGGSILDIGCGPADPTIRFAHAYPDADLIGLDGSEEMLSRARQAVRTEGLSERIQLVQAMLREDVFPPGSFAAIICNSFLHHLEDPQILWRSIRQLAKVDAPVLVMDLMRPDSEKRARELVALHAQGAPELMAHDFYNSLLAAFRPEEVHGQLAEAGLLFQIDVVSDRHMVIHGKNISPSSLY